VSSGDIKEMDATLKCNKQLQ